MIILPSLFDKIVPRPGRPDFEESYLIPDSSSHTQFWRQVYRSLRELKLHSPVIRDIKKYVNPLFGYFGFRVHPVTHNSKYFHVGLSLDLKAGRSIYPVASGILEYAGYGAVNGYYILLSHPQIQTEDGYTLHTMYCHLKKPLVKFNSYQKMLREISLGSYPLVRVETNEVLGLASTSGLSRDNSPGLYLQFSFRKFGHTPIVVDPLRVYQKTSRKNKTADITESNDIEQIFTKKQN